jgi:hypothetical protein
VNCVACQRPLNPRGRCPEPIECNFEARLRLGMPLWQARKLRGEEFSAGRAVRFAGAHVEAALRGAA